MLEHLSKLFLAVAVFTEPLLDLVVSSKLSLEHGLTLLLFFDLLVNRSNLVTPATDLFSFITWVEDHVLVETFLQALLLGHQLVGLLLVLDKAIVECINLGLILYPDTFYCGVHMLLNIAVHGCARDEQ